MNQTKAMPAQPLHDPNPEALPILLSVRQAAQLMGVGKTLTWELIRSGALPSIKLGRRTLIPRKAIEQLARAHEPAR